MAAFDFPNSPSTNDTHTQNGVQWKWNGSVWKRVESVGEKGQKGVKGQKGEDNSTKGQKGEVEKGQKGEPSTVKGQKGEVGQKGEKGSVEASGTKGQKGEPGADNSTKGQKGEAGAATINNNADNRVITGSNTSGELNAESGLTYDSSSMTLTTPALAVGDIKRGTTNGTINITQEGSGQFTVHRTTESRHTNPESDSTYDLGTSTKRWRTVYADSFDGLNGTITYNNAANDRVITSHDSSTIHAETNMTYNDTNGLYVDNHIQATGRIRPSVGNAGDKGIYWPTDPGGGAGDAAWIRYYAESGENMRLEVGIANDADDDIQLTAGRVHLNTATTVTKNLQPWVNNSYDLGTSSNRWNNLYINDLQLSNESRKDTGGNDVDGTWGNYTIQEGEDDLFLINRRSGKKYKFLLKEVD